MKNASLVQSFYVKYTKRLLDIILSACALLVLSPVLLLISIAVVIDSPGPVLFRQKRFGKGKTHFYILKFRTMRTDAPANMPTHELADPQKWITRTGRFLRKTSLDELPQILNILQGHMSIIGPRPALWNQYDLIEAREQYGANDIRPGLTGWAQINGRDELSIETKVAFDGEYAQNISFSFDLRCFFGTIFTVLRGDGIVEGKHAGENTVVKNTSSDDENNPS